ncbi:MAG: hypothetical protein KDA33_03215 [Phycisphaerales bacterium]|nr:hypothetical protein [Phycisphaerales bacterium]
MDRQQNAINRIIALAMMGIAAGAANGQTISNYSQGTTHATLQDALDQATNGNIIQIGPGVLYEDNLRIPAGVNVTIRGGGQGATFIDGTGGSSAKGVFELIDSQQGFETIIQDLTIRNDVRGAASGGTGGAVFMSGDVRLTLRRVTLTGNRGIVGFDGARAVHVRNGAKVRLRECRVLDNDGANGAAIIISGASSEASLTGALIQHGSDAISVENQGTLYVVGCTIVGAVAIDASGYLGGTNSILTEGYAVAAGGQVGLLRCLYPGATSGNVDGDAIFVDADARDYRLAAGSPGIDAASMISHVDGVGTFVDLAGRDRIVDDSGTADTGLGELRCLDIGAYEYQGDEATSTCPGDMNGDGVVNGLDTQLFVIELLAGGVCP